MSNKAFEELVEDMGLDSLPEKDRENILAKLTQAVTARVFVEAMKKIGEKGRIEYAQIVSQEPSSQDLQDFFSNKIKDFDGLVLESIEKMRQERVALF